MRDHQTDRGEGGELAHPRYGLDTSTASGRLMLNVLGSVAQFEREVMLERQREGIAKAKGEGKYKGRKPTARAKADGINPVAAEGLTREAIAAQLGVSVRSVYRVLGLAA
jgi:DNA invertase Pin-like site-specific DNA recombinase